MGMGYLKVELSTGGGALPVSSIHVLIKSSDGDALYDVITDESGNTEKIKLEAPNAPRLYNPNDTMPRYNLYDVEVKPQKGYMGKLIHGVHVFDNETTILPVNMAPNTNGEKKLPEYEAIHIPPRFGIEMEKGFTALEPKLISSQAMGDVIIPDYITVHLGSPNATANNVRVKFIDYVKVICI